MCLNPRGSGGDAFEREFVYLNVACLFVSEKECGFVCECLRCCCGREGMCLSVCLQFSSGRGYIYVPLRLGPDGANSRWAIWERLKSQQLLAKTPNRLRSLSCESLQLDKALRYGSPGSQWEWRGGNSFQLGEAKNSPKPLEFFPWVWGPPLHPFGSPDGGSAYSRNLSVLAAMLESGLLG